MKNAGTDRLREIWNRRKRLAGLLFVVSLSAAISLVFSLPDLYRATATMVVEGQAVPEAFVRSAVTSEIETRLNMITQKILSRSRLEDLIRSLDLYPGLRKRVSMETVMERMRKDIQPELKWADQRGGQRTAVAFTIGYIGRDPRTVARVANTLASFYIEENLQIRERQAAGTAEVLWQQLQEVQQRLDRQIPENRFSGTEPSGLTDDPDALPVRIARLKQELTELRTRYSEKYPDVVRIRDEIAALERQRAEENVSPTDSSSAPPTRDYRTTKELYDSLIKRYADARLAENLEQRRQGEQFRILDTAVPPEQPVAPNRIRLLLFALMFSLALSVGAAALAEQMDTSFHSVEEIRAFTRVSVLASIPRIVTSADVRRRHRRLCLMGISVMLCLMLMIGASYYIAHENERLVWIMARGRL